MSNLPKSWDEPDTLAPGVYVGTVREAKRLAAGGKEKLLLTIGGTWGDVDVWLSLAGRGLYFARKALDTLGLASLLEPKTEEGEVTR